MTQGADLFTCCYCGAIRSGPAERWLLGQVCSNCRRAPIAFRPVERREPIPAPEPPVSLAVARVSRLEHVGRRDGWTCHLCAKPIDPAIRNGPKRATLDHLIPRSQGGLRTLDNLKIAHAICNERRGVRPLEVVSSSSPPPYPPGRMIG